MKNRFTVRFPFFHAIPFLAFLFLLAACDKKDAPAEDTTPTITSFTPAQAPEGASVEILGHHFATTLTGNSVKFNGLAATVTAVTADGTKITATVPDNATSGKITVLVGDKTVTSTSDFTVNPSLPGITSFSPDKGDIGSTVQLTGVNFKAGMDVYFGAIKATEVTLQSRTQLTAKVPTGAVNGKIKVVFGTAEALSATDFRIMPIISAMSPTRGARGSSVVITGEGFKTDTKVFVGSIEVTATDFISRTDARIEFKVPATAEGGDVKIEQSGRQSIAGTFVVTDVIKTLTPYPGGNRDGKTVFSFGNRLYVLFGNSGSTLYRDVWYYNAVNDTWIQGQAPPAEMTFRYASLFPVVIDDKVYLFQSFEKQVWEFSPLATGAKWRRMNDLPATVSNILNTAFSVGTKAYIVTSEGNAGGRVFEFDPMQNDNLGAYSEKARMPYEFNNKSSSVSIAVGARGLVSGGLGNSPDISSNYYWYDPAAANGSGSWTLAGSLPSAIDNPVLFSFNNKIFMGGGLNSTRTASSNKLYRFNNASSTWELVNETFAFRYAVDGGGTAMGRILLMSSVLNEFYEYVPAD